MENEAFFRGYLRRLESAYPQRVRSCGLWIVKTTHFERIVLFYKQYSWKWPFLSVKSITVFLKENATINNI